MHKNGPILRFSALGLLLCILLVSRTHADEDFPRPAAIEPAVQFWIRVYTEVDTDSGFLHDARNLGVVYRRVNYNRQEIEQYRGRIQEDLRVLASGKRDNLTGHQQQVLEAWPDGVSNEQLAEAAGSVRFQLGQSDRFVAGLVRSGAYREYIDRVARERDLPVELGALPHVESSFHPGAYSHAHAAGMWQFIRATGQRFMRVDHIVDERMDPYAATYAAMSLLEYNYRVLGSWPLALTAYNHGAAGMARAVRETGSDRIEDIIENYRGRAFGFASRNFYPQFLAVVEVERRAQALFGVLQLDPTPDYDQFELHAYVEARDLADQLGVSLEQLRFDNPALRPIVWEGGKRIPSGYTVKIQRQSLNGGRGLEQQIAAMPANRLYAYQTPDVSYVVQRGDSLSAIAGRFDTSVSQLVSLNQLQSAHRIRVGQELLLPHDTNMANQTMMAAVASDARPNDVSPGDGVYHVSAGDTLSIIAGRFDTSEAVLMQLNGLSNPDRIYQGQELQLPAAGDTGSSLATAESPEPAAETAVAAREVATGSVAPSSNAPEASAPGAERAVMPAAPGSMVAIVNELEAQTLAQEGMPSVGEQIARASEVLAADPSDYSVGADQTIEIQATETLGHYADWLGVRAQQLRSLNGLAFNQPVIVGDRLRLDFSEVDVEQFEMRRRQYHVAQQEQFFRSYRIQDLARHEIAANDNIAAIARQRYSVPLWLLRQYNPELDFRQVRIGQTVVVPVVEAVDEA